MSPVARASAPLAALAALAGCWGCALPSVEEAGKDACLTSADCLYDLRCIDRTCGQPRDPLLACERQPGWEPCKGEVDYCYRGLCADKYRTLEACDCDAGDWCLPDIEAERDNIVPAGELFCFALPACDGDACPVGPYGAVCADGVCLPGRCEAPADCPPTYHCIDLGAAYGYCSPGNEGNPCRDHDDCENDCDLTEQACLGPE